jgi:hypothetical protein
MRIYNDDRVMQMYAESHDRLLINYHHPWFYVNVLSLQTDFNIYNKYELQHNKCIVRVQLNPKIF